MRPIKRLSTRRHALSFDREMVAGGQAASRRALQLKIIRRILNFLELRANWEASKYGGGAIVRVSVRRRRAATVSEAGIPVAEAISGCGARSRTRASGIGSTKRRRRLWRRC
jgi:hypothetical protein